MKHSVHIERIALGQSIQVWLEASKATEAFTAKGNPKAYPWKSVAAAVGVSPRRCRRAHNYWLNHKNEPRLEECRWLRHADVVTFGATGLETLREQLIRNYTGGGVRPARPRPRLMTNAQIKEWATVCGLETFSHNGRRYIHWKHAPPRQKSNAA